MRPTREMRPRPILSLGLGGTIGGSGSITIQDLANYFEGTTLEEILAEIGAKLVGYEAHGNMGAAETFDAATGWHSGTLDDDCTFTLTANPSGTVSSLFLELAQDGTGGWTMTLPASVTNRVALEAAQDTTADTTSLLVLLSRDGGTTWYGGWWGGSGATALDDLTDVNASSPSDGEVLTWDSTPGEWIAAPPTTIADLDDLTDVTITTPAEDDDLRYNGSVWVNDARKWEAVTDGEDVFVWESDDLVYEWSA